MRPDAELIGRYPLEDYPELPLPQQVSIFCLPFGATVEHWPPESRHPLPIFSTFVLTGETGERLYGGSVIFYEDFPADRLKPEQLNQLGLISAHQAPPSQLRRGVGRDGRRVGGEGREVAGESGELSSEGGAVNTIICKSTESAMFDDRLENSEGVKSGSLINDDDVEASATGDLATKIVEAEVDKLPGMSQASTGISATGSLNVKEAGVIQRGGVVRPPQPVMLHQNKAIALLSRWPFFETFKKILFYLYRISVSGPQPIPIERWVCVGVV